MRTEFAVSRSGSLGHSDALIRIPNSDLSSTSAQSLQPIWEKQLHYSIMDIIPIILVWATHKYTDYMVLLVK